MAKVYKKPLFLSSPGHILTKIPFYTGKQKFVDTARRVEKFQEKAARVAATAAGRKGKKAKQAARATKKIAKKTTKEA